MDFQADLPQTGGKPGPVYSANLIRRVLRLLILRI